MSKIDEMLKNENVEWRKLGEVAYILKGKQFNKRDMLENGEFPVINDGILPSGFIDIFNSDENTITISQGGASAGSGVRTYSLTIIFLNSKLYFSMKKRPPDR